VLFFSKPCSLYNPPSLLFPECLFHTCFFLFFRFHFFSFSFNSDRSVVFLTRTVFLTFRPSLYTRVFFYSPMIFRRFILGVCLMSPLVFPHSCLLLFSRFLRHCSWVIHPSAFIQTNLSLFPSVFLPRIYLRHFIGALVSVLKVHFHRNFCFPFCFQPPFFFSF